MAVSEDKTRTIISLEKDLKAKLESLAKQEDRSFNNYVVKILKDHVQSLEGKEWFLIPQRYSGRFIQPDRGCGLQPSNLLVNGNQFCQ